MTAKDFTKIILVDASPEVAFNAINNVRGWWSEDIEGPTDELDGIFFYKFRDVHQCTVKVVELVPNKRVVWEVLENHFNFIQDKSEWVGTRMIFEISEKENKTQIRFTHEGLVPDYECYAICDDAWSTYIQSSLAGLINTGKGEPNPKEGGFNEWLLNKHERNTSGK
jgi:hypothetical protein